MAYALRATYTQENNFSVTDRIEIYEDDFEGSVIELEGRSPCAFDFEHRESTSTQRGYLSIFENQIIMGVLDLYAWIDTEAKKSLVTDMADAPTKQFQIRWKRDGNEVWYGFPYGRIVEYPDKPQYNVKIQFRDFEVLKGEDFPLDDTRRKIEASFRNFFSKFGFLLGDPPMRTITSWQVDGTTTSDDFLNQVWHDTYVLRDYASDGYSQDQTITYFEALKRIAEPMLIIYQWKGFNVFQISGLKDPSNALVSTYGILGQLTSASTDIRQTIYMNTGLSTPWAKTITNNTSYPAIRKVYYEYKHQSGSSKFEFDVREDVTVFDYVDFDGSDHYISTLPFSGNGDEKLNFRGFFESPNESDDASFAVHVGAYALDSDFEFKTVANHSGVGQNPSSVDTANNRFNIFADPYSVGDPVMLESTGALPSPINNSTVYYVIAKDDGADWIQLSDTPDGNAVNLTDSGSGTITVRVITVYEETEVRFSFYEAFVSFTSGDIPAITSADMEVILINNSAPTELAWYNMNVTIQNPTQAGESLEYRLTQDELYPDDFRLPDSYYGDGPYSYSKSSFRTSISLNDTTSGVLNNQKSWRRRGEASYEFYSRLKLREVLDFQRVRQVKKQFELWGEFDPIKVSVYDSDNYMYVGGKYNGRWSPIMVKIEENLDG